MKRRTEQPKKLKEREGRKTSTYSLKRRGAVVSGTAGADVGAIGAAMMRAKEQAEIKTTPRHQRAKVGTKDSHSSA